MAAHWTVYLRDRGDSLVGIVNGVDYDIWNPATDGMIPQAYDIKSWRFGKHICKRQLRSEMGLAEIGHRADRHRQSPGIAKRLGLDTAAHVHRWLQTERPVQWVVLGTGEEPIELELTRLAQNIIRPRWPIEVTVLGNA